MDRRKVLIAILVCAVLLAAILLLAWHSSKSSSGQPSAQEMFNTLNSYMTSDLRCPPLTQGGVVRVYVSGGMFNLSDSIYSVGINGLKPGINYQSINLIDMICNLSDAQWATLNSLCTTWDVPVNGVVGEIKKLGWECFCPVRDGITMAVIAAAISASTIDMIPTTDPKSVFYLPTIKQKLKNDNPTNDQIVAYARGLMNGALGTNVGANDLYNMYSTCNCCILNYNGIQADAGAIAEVGQLGARGVPCVIIKGTLTGDFSGISNPMPIMATTSSYVLKPNLTNNAGSIFTTSHSGALPWLQAKVERLINANVRDDPLTYGNYNNAMPLPPLQIFWSQLGSKCFFLKHRSKSIATTDVGFVDFQRDYTPFWFNNVISGGTKGQVAVAVAMADNLASFLADPKFRNVMQYWA